MTTYTLGNNCVIRDDGAFIPLDPANRDYADYLAWLAAGGVPAQPPGPTVAERIAAVTAAVQTEMDSQAQAKGYDNILSACSYASQPVGATFQAEGAAFLQWRSDVWSQAYATLAQVQAGTKPLPTPAEAVAQMPTLVLP